MSRPVIELTCPHPTADDTPCEAVVLVPAEWTPGEMYGADRDGNRGEWRDGYLTAGDAPATCAAGCLLTRAERAALDAEAAREARRETRDAWRGR